MRPRTLQSILALMAIFTPAVVWVGRVEAQTADPDYVLALSDVSGFPGETVEVSVDLAFPNGREVAGFSFGVCASPGDGSLVVNPCLDNVPNDCFSTGVIVPGAGLAGFNNGMGPTLFAANTYTSPAGGWTVGTIFGFSDTELLAPHSEAEIIVAKYQIVGATGNVSELSFCDLGNPTVARVVLLSDGSEVFPENAGGMVAIVTTTFVRGDTNGDGAYDGLADAVFLFESTFVPGSPPPPCLEGADADGNGRINALVDGLFLLHCQFLPGSPCPADPFPRCGADPEPSSSLGCAASECP